MGDNGHDEHDERKECCDGMDDENSGESIARVGREIEVRKTRRVVSYFYLAASISNAVPKYSEVDEAIVCDVFPPEGDCLNDRGRQNRKQQQCKCHEQQYSQRRCWPQHHEGWSARTTSREAATVDAVQRCDCKLADKEEKRGSVEMMVLYRENVWSVRRFGGTKSRYSRNDGGCICRAWLERLIGYRVARSVGRSDNNYCY